MKKVRLYQTSEEKNKLALVKILKDNSHYGLKDSKSFVDTLCEKTRNLDPKPYVDVEVLDSCNLSKLSDDLNNSCTGKYYINFTSQELRNLKMLEIGIGEISDYVEFIKDEILSSSLNRSKGILDLILSEMSEDDIKKVFNKIDKNIK